jgi:hypothetical protein
MRLSHIHEAWAIPLRSKISPDIKDSPSIEILSWQLDGRIDWRDDPDKEWGFLGNATIELTINNKPSILVLINYNNVDGPQDILLDGSPVDVVGNQDVSDLWDNIYKSFPPLLDVQLNRGKSPRDKNVGPGHQISKYVVNGSADPCWNIDNL